MKCWDVINRNLLVDASPYLKLLREAVRLEDGTIVDDYYTIEQLDFVVIFALVRSDTILAIRHYKHGAKKINLGLPAGYVENKESPADAARRELLEETGYRAESVRLLGSYVVDGNRGCGHAHVVFATGLTRQQDADPDDLETIVLEEIPISDLPGLLASGEVATLGAAIGIALGLLEVKNMGT